MKSYFAYIRVSTARQGEEGVSLQEQKGAILEFALKRGMTISGWFEERISAAKRGRPVFTKVVGLLKSKKAAGIIIHKIDRGARNLRDWADIAELMDRGIEVHFAHESIDLHTRSGRLSADILAVVAADYIRNLREETIKGINGRLRQGLFPFAAPVGYMNNGGGKPKTIDPMSGPLIKQAFELYATRRYSQSELAEEMFKRGLRTRTGRIVYLSQIATILRNPFYMGLIQLKNRKDMYPGIHTPLITSSLFNEVQLVLDGKRTQLKQHNWFLFRLFLRCEYCKLYLVGERKKGHVYYRCHRKLCPVTCIREERIEEVVVEALKRIAISPEEEPIISEILANFRKREAEITQKLRRETEDEIAHIQSSLRSLVQKFLDSVLPKETFDETHASLLMQRKLCEDKLDGLDTDHHLYERVEAYFNFLRSLQSSFCENAPGQIRNLMERVFTEIVVDRKTVRVVPTSISGHVLARERTKESWTLLLPLIIENMAQNIELGSNVQDTPRFSTRIRTNKKALC